MVKVKAQTEDLVVIDLESDLTPSSWVLGEFFHPKILRVYKDRMEIVGDTGTRKNRVKHFYFHDLLMMNFTLFRIMHPEDRKPAK